MPSKLFTTSMPVFLLNCSATRGSADHTLVKIMPVRRGTPGGGLSNRSQMPPDPQLVELPAPRMIPTSSSSGDTADLRLKSTSAPVEDAAQARIIEGPIFRNFRLDALMSFSNMIISFSWNWSAIPESGLQSARGERGIRSEPLIDAFPPVSGLSFSSHASPSQALFFLSGMNGHPYQTTGCKTPFSFPKSLMYGSIDAFEAFVTYGDPMVQFSGRAASGTISPFFSRWE